MAAPRTIALPERYRVERRIATGGMASVWAAHDEVLRRRVAVKVLSPVMGDDEELRARFTREAHATARMSGCDHVVTIYDVGEHAGRAFIVMEYLGGGTVRDRLQEHGIVDRATAVRWLREAATALDCAHDHGIVHRDVKPANLLLDEGDRLAVADFGIAHVADATRQLTAVGMVVGTAAYFSPEQALGQSVTSASDRYALAAIAFELLCGERPYPADHATAQARQHAEAPIPRITGRAPHLPSAVDAVLARGLAKDPAERPATAAELVDELERALREPPAETTQAVPRVTQPAPRPRAPRPARTAPPPPPRSGRSLRIAALLAVLAALAGAGAVLAVTLGGQPDEPAGRVPRAERTPTADERTATTPPATSEEEPAPTATEEPPQTATEEPPQTATEEPPQTATTPAPALEGSPSELNDAGFALIQQERYAEAVPPLQRSVEGFRAQGQTTDLPYAFALYNLAYALARVGREDEAVPLLEERLRVSDNQRGVVRRELRRIQGEGEGS